MANFRFADDDGTNVWLEVSEYQGSRAFDVAAETGEGDLIYEAQRERVQFGFSLGQVLLKRAVDLEQDIGDADELGEKANQRLMAAWGVLPEVEEYKGGFRDQYRINGMHLVSIGQALFGDREEARKVAHQSVRRALTSESPSFPTSADLGFAYRMRAVGRASVRALAANVIAHSPESERGRGFALRLAQKVI
jgi:hypothetical protein